jgi:hypothetical protein
MKYLGAIPKQACLPVSSLDRKFIVLSPALGFLGPYPDPKIGFTTSGNKFNRGKRASEVCDGVWTPPSNHEHSSPGVKIHHYGSFFRFFLPPLKQNRKSVPYTSHETVTFTPTGGVVLYPHPNQQPGTPVPPFPGRGPFYPGVPGDPAAVRVQSIRPAA